MLMRNTGRIRTNDYRLTTESKTDAKHASVLLHEVVDGLALKPDDVVVDGTLGLGGHSLEIVKRLGANGTLIGIDRDERAIEKAKERLLGAKPKTHFVSGNYCSLKTILADLGFASADKILLDLGMSSYQLEPEEGETGRGFSFKKDEPLLMTFEANPTPEALSAKEILNTWEEEHIENVLSGYGEERFARRIARGIVGRRVHGSIERTGELVGIILENTPKWYHRGRIHPATKTFQALRIAVNDEIEGLRQGLSEGYELLTEQGRMAVITFHSIEDRIVKRTFKEFGKEGGVVITKKPVRPSERESTENPRARSAKLRVIEKGS